jgi:hypothetical protein
MKRILIFLIFLFSVSVYPPLSIAQSAETKKEMSEKKKKKNKLAEREKRRKEKEIHKAEEAGRKNHMAIQTKDVRRRMKRNQKNTQASYDGKKKLFIARWFSRK